MIFSHEQRLIFIGVPKTGSKSVAASLRIDSDNSYSPHTTAREVREQMEAVGMDWRAFYKFSIVRNPWERYFSFANFLISLARERDPGCGRPPVRLVLRDLILRARSTDDFLLDEDGRLAVDRVGEFGNLDAEFAMLCDRVQLEGRALAHLGRGQAHEPMDEVYDAELVDMVAEKERWVIDRMGYCYGR